MTRDDAIAWLEERNLFGVRDALIHGARGPALDTVTDGALASSYEVATDGDFVSVKTKRNLTPREAIALGRALERIAVPLQAYDKLAARVEPDGDTRWLAPESIEKLGVAVELDAYPDDVDESIALIEMLAERLPDAASYDPERPEKREGCFRKAKLLDDLRRAKDLE